MINKVNKIDREAKVGAVELRGTTMVKNIFINILGIGVPYLVGFVTIPFIIKGMGLERFGLLSLVWVVIGYFNFMDLGLSRATTKYVAEALGEGRLDRIPDFVGTTMALQCCLGIIGTASLILLTPLIVDKALNIPQLYIGEVRTSLIVLAFSIPIILLSSSLRGVLESAQRFDLINVVKIPVSASFYLLPLVGLAIGFRLPGIIALLVLARFVSLLFWGRNYFKLFSHLPGKLVFRWSLVKSLIGFGGWVTISSIIFTITNSVDRLLIGSLRSIRELSFYSAPQEVVMKFGIFAGSLSLILFPAFSSLMGGREEERSKILYVRSLKFILMCIGPIVVFFMFYAKPFLRIWLGGDFSSSSSLIMQILSLGVLFSSISGVPFNYLQGIGKVALVTKLQIAEMIFFIPFSVVMIKRWGIQGAAIAVGARTFLLMAALLIIAQKSRRIEKLVWMQTDLWRSITLSLAGGIVLIIFFQMRWRSVGAIIYLLFISIATFYWVLDSQERRIFRDFKNNLFLRFGKKVA